MRRIETYDWWPELISLKDKLSLRELAERFDVTPGAISAALKRTGTVRKPAPPGPRARRRKVEALPPEPGDSATTPSPRPGSKDARVAPFFDQLGNVPDADVAKQAGVSVRTIASYRARHGIVGYTGPRKRRGGRRARRSKIDPYVDMLGTVPDRVVAEKAGVSLNAVRNYRVKRGIAASSRRGRRPGATTKPPAAPVKAAAAAPAPAPPAVQRPRQGSGGGAWRVVSVRRGAEASCIVVAPTLGAAAARVDTADLGQVVRLEWLGTVL